MSKKNLDNTKSKIKTLFGVKSEIINISIGIYTNGRNIYIDDTHVPYENTKNEHNITITRHRTSFNKLNDYLKANNNTKYLTKIGLKNALHLKVIQVGGYFSIELLTDNEEYRRKVEIFALMYSPNEKNYTWGQDKMYLICGEYIFYNRAHIEERIRSDIENNKDENELMCGCIKKRKGSIADEYNNLLTIIHKNPKGMPKIKEIDDEYIILHFMDSVVSSYDIIEKKIEDIVRSFSDNINPLLNIINPNKLYFNKGRYWYLDILSFEENTQLNNGLFIKNTGSIRYVKKDGEILNEGNKKLVKCIGAEL